MRQFPRRPAAGFDWERQGFLSIWMGNFGSDAEFDRYVEHQYDDDDAAITLFAADFNIDYYDEDFMESWFACAQLEAMRLLGPLSYSESYAERAAAVAADMLTTANAVIMILDLHTT